MLIFFIVSMGFYALFSTYIDNSKVSKSLDIVVNDVENLATKIITFFNDDQINSKINEIITSNLSNNTKQIGYKLYQSTGVHSNITFYDNENLPISSDEYFDIPTSIKYFLRGIDVKKFDITFANYITPDSESLLVMKKNIIFKGSSIGIITVVIPSTEFSKVINDSDFKYVITDRFGKVFINTIGDISPVNKFNNNSISGYVSKQTRLKNINIYVYIPKSFSLKNLIIFECIFLIPILLIILLMDLLTKRTINIHTKSMIELIDQISEIKENKRHRLNIVSDNEFSYLSNAINNLINSIEELNSKTSKLEYENKLSELKRMQSQFNAHFLYNTLELIRTLMHVDLEKTNKLIYDFSSLLRYSLNDLNSICLGEDIIYIRKFMEISRIRYNRNFSYQINIDENLMEMVVPKLFLQPFIENTIKYGFFHREKIDIIINGFIENNSYVFEVIDNGKPIDDNTLNSINSSLSNMDKSLEKSNHHGITNSVNRLRLIYGNIDARFIKSDFVYFRMDIKKDV